MRNIKILFFVLAIFITKTIAQCNTNCNCSDSSNTSLCTSCKNGYFFNANSCTSCSSNCSACTSTNDCTNCSNINGSTSHFDSVTTSCRTCAQLWGECQICTISGCTTRCGSGKKWKDGSCQSDSWWSWANFWKLLSSILLPCLLLCCLLGLLAYFCKPKKKLIVEAPAPIVVAPLQAKTIHASPVQVQRPVQQLPPIQLPVIQRRLEAGQALPSQIKSQFVQGPSTTNQIQRQVQQVVNGSNNQYFRGSGLS